MPRRGEVGWYEPDIDHIRDEDGVCFIYRDGKDPTPCAEHPAEQK